MKQKTSIKKIFLSSVILLLLITFSYTAWFYLIGRNINLTYTSTNLGIKFNYQPITNDGKTVKIIESENKIYVLTNKENKENAAYVEIIKLNKNADIQEAIQNYIIQHFRDDDCFRVYNMTDAYENNTNWKISCGTPNGIIKHQDYFSYDKNNPNKFIFFNIDYLGQNGFISSKNWVQTASNKSWFTTLTIK